MVLLADPRVVTITRAYPAIERERCYAAARTMLISSPCTQRVREVYSRYSPPPPGRLSLQRRASVQDSCSPVNRPMADTTYRSSGRSSSKQCSGSCTFPLKENSYDTSRKFQISVARTAGEWWYTAYGGR